MRIDPKHNYMIKNGYQSRSLHQRKKSLSKSNSSTKKEIYVSFFLLAFVAHVISVEKIVGTHYSTLHI